MSPRPESPLPDLPRDEEGPVFHEPWEAQAFAMAVTLHARGLFTWPEWAAALGAEIAQAEATGNDEDYYRCWLAALERLLDEKGVVPARERLARRDAWDRAARATPHGQPIRLSGET